MTTQQIVGSDQRAVKPWDGLGLVPLVTEGLVQPSVGEGQRAALSPTSVLEAQDRLAGVLHRTPLATSATLDAWLGHTLIFKCENQQKTGAFKARGAYHTLLRLRETRPDVDTVVLVSSGNHAQACAWAGAKLGFKVRAFLPESASSAKRQATAAYGAEVIVCASRLAAEAGARAACSAPRTAFVPPFDHDDIIAGQGTACLEALQDGAKPDAIFAAVGGGGWLSGSLLAARLLAPSARVFGAEPALACDAAASLAAGRILSFAQAPATLADGAQTRHVAPRTFALLQQSDGIRTVSEAAMCYWTQWLTHLLKQSVEPTSAMAMAAAADWLREARQPQRVLVLLSGGNLDHATRRAVWADDALSTLPNATLR